MALVDRVRRLSLDMLEKYRSEFGEDFAENKKTLDSISVIRSKGLKNEIAGYITKVIKNEMRTIRMRETQEWPRAEEEKEQKMAEAMTKKTTIGNARQQQQQTTTSDADSGADADAYADDITSDTSAMQTLPWEPVAKPVTTDPEPSSSSSLGTTATTNGLNVENKIRIDKYIDANSDANTGETFPISLKGEKKSLVVYKLPADMLFYNIRNGRFAAEYNEMIRTEGGYLNPQDKADEEKIKRLLLNLNPGETKRTYDDLKIRGQWNCGIITEDGYLIDGNRRKAIISEIYKDTRQEQWRYLIVARLEKSVTSEDLWALEAGIQLGKDEIVRYGPINELLKIREGIQAGLSEKAMVNALYGYDTEEEIRDKIDRLKLIEQYLTFIGKPERYSLAKQSAEHFIDLQNIIKSCNNGGYKPDTVMKIKHVTFQLIWEGVPHMDIRKINQMIKNDLVDAIQEIEEAWAHLKPASSEDPTSKEMIEHGTDEGIDELDSEIEEDISPTRTRFTNATDILDASNNERNEIRLLSRAEMNLKKLLLAKSDSLRTPDASELIKKIVDHVQKIEKIIE